MSATLKNKHLAGAPVAGIALAIALLAAMLLVLFPGRAEAQEQEEEQATNNAETTTTVQPGDSLWTMAQARLAPDPAPQRVALEVERIYALNQDRIGPDPDLIIAGQELLVPSANEPATEEVGATLQPASPEPATVRPEEEIPASAATTVEEAPAPAAELPVLPEEAERNFTVREIVPQASTLISPFSDLSDTESRMVLGVGIIFLTLVLALLIAWRLPLRARRTVGSSSSWGSYGGAYGAGRAYDDDYSHNYALSEQGHGRAVVADLHRVGLLRGEKPVEISDAHLAHLQVLATPNNDLPAKDPSEHEGPSVGQESASPEETVEEKPEPADERVADVGGTTETRDDEDDPTGGDTQREHLRLVEETPTDGQDQHHEQRRTGGGR